jgi:parvulin-like peptidyl-prolyl isomerase
MKRVLATCLTIACLAPPLARAGVYTDAVAAIVRDRVITVFDLHQETLMAELQLREKLSGDQLQTRVVELRKVAAQKLIEEELIYAEFQELGGRVPRDLVLKRLDRIIQSRSGGDRRQFEKALLAQNMTMADFEEKAARSLAVELLLQEKVFRAVHVSPAMVEQYYQKHQADFGAKPAVQTQMLVLRKDGRYAADLDGTVKTIQERLAKGVAFGDLAREFSEDPSAEKEGDLGWLNVEEINPRFAESLKDVTPGGVTAPITTDDGVVLLRLVARQAATAQSLDDALRLRIEEILRREEEHVRYRAFVADLEKKFYVRKYF